MPNDYEDMEQESRLYPWVDLAMTEEYYDEEWDEEYDEWQDYFPLMGGDDWDHGQYDNGEW